MPLCAVVSVGNSWGRSEIRTCGISVGRAGAFAGSRCRLFRGLGPGLPGRVRGPARVADSSQPGLTLVGDTVSSSGSRFGAEPCEVDGAGGVECFLGAADGESGEQEGVLVAVAGG